MKKVKTFCKTLIVCGAVLTVLPASTQNYNTDSLQRVLNNIKIDSATIYSMLLTGFKMPNKNAEAKFLIYNWGIESSKKINSYKNISFAYRNIGLLHRDLYNVDEAVKNLHQALSVAEKNNLYKYQAQALMGLASVYRSRGIYERAIEYDKQAIAVQENNTKDKMGLGAAYYSLGNSLFNSKLELTPKRQEEIEDYFNKAINICEQTNDSFALVQILNGICGYYAQTGKSNKAELYMNQAERQIEKLKLDKAYTSFYLNKGRVYDSKHQYEQAIENYKKGVAYSLSNNESFLLTTYYGNISLAYAALGDTVSAYHYLKKYDTAFYNKTQEEKVRTLAVIDGQFQKEKKDKEIDRLNTEQRIRQLELEKQEATIAGNFLEAKRKEDEIELLSQKKELQELQLVQQEQVMAKNQLQAKADSQKIEFGKQAGLLQEKQISNQKRTRNYLIGGVGLLGLLAFILYRNITAKKKAYTQLQHKSEQLKEQALQLSKQAKLIAQFQSQMNPHFVYNALHNIQGLVLTDEKRKANSQIQSLAQLMRKTFANADKDDIPLEEEINYLNKYIEFEKTAFGNSLDFEVQVAKEAEGAVVPPMMIQPFIENAIKHAELKKVENPYIKVLIETENNLLAINITDNGTGIKKDVNEADKLSHSLSVIKSRLDLLFKGKADVNSHPVFSVKTIPEINEGTSIKFYLPLNYSY